MCLSITMFTALDNKEAFDKAAARKAVKEHQARFGRISDLQGYVVRNMPKCKNGKPGKRLYGTFYSPKGLSGNRYTEAYLFDKVYFASGNSPAGTRSIEPSASGKYMPGFHVFLNLKDAKTYGEARDYVDGTAVVVAVRYAGVLAAGTQYVKTRHRPCVVAYAIEHTHLA